MPTLLPACCCSPSLQLQLGFQLSHPATCAFPAAIRDGTQRVVLKSGRVKDPPAQLSAVWRMEAYAAEMGPEFSDDASDEHIAVGAPQDAAAQAEERAARLAQRRYAREVALAPRGQKRPGRPPAVQLQRKPDRPRSAPGRPAPARAAAASPILYQGGNVRGPPAGRGKTCCLPLLAVCMPCESALPALQCLAAV